jgi:general secretion pathway protein J
MRKHLSGFTLIELLVAMVVFAILATMAYGGLRAVIRTSNGVQIQMKALEELQRAFMYLERDFLQVTQRESKNALGRFEPALKSSRSGDELVEFTRGGHSNPAGLVRSSLQRVGYIIEDQSLYRQSWDKIDHLAVEEPQKVKLLGDVESLSFRFYDGSRSRWQDSWPPGNKSMTLPTAIEIDLKHKKWGEIKRVIVISR